MWSSFLQFWKYTISMIHKRINWKIGLKHDVKETEKTSHRLEKNICPSRIW